MSFNHSLFITAHLGPPFLSVPMIGRPSGVRLVAISHTPNQGCCDSIRANPIVKGSLALFGDRRWMSLLVDFFGGASHICTLVGDSAAHVVPYLSIVSFPFYLYHAIKESKERFLLMKAAYHTSQVAEALFWGIRALGSVGTALGDLIKPMAGGVTLIGIAATPALHLTFQLIFPIILIVLSTLGGCGQYWAFKRIKADLHRYHFEMNRLDGSLESLKTVLHYLQGPQCVQGENPDRYAIQLKRFKDSHSTNSERRTAVQSRIEALLCDQRAQLDFIREALPLLERGYEIGLELSPTLDHIERVIALSDEFLQMEQISSEISDKIAQGRKELIVLKNTLYLEGIEIADMVKSEIHRKLSEQVIAILIATITFIAGVLFLACPLHAKIGSALALTASVLGILNIAYSKGLSLEQFLYMERQLLGSSNTISKKITGY